MSTKTKTRGRKPVPTKKSTALARKPITVHVTKPDKKPAALAPIGTLTDDVQLGALGLVEIKLTKHEEAVLAQPLNERDVQVIEEARGTPVYVTHGRYTQLFNEAFGRLGWTISPCAKPTIATSPNGQQTVVCPYILYIHGRPAAYALGEQDYYENNKQATYGNAYEATVASALRRVSKRLGIWLELWDRRWTSAFLAKRGHAQQPHDSMDGEPQRRREPAVAHHSTSTAPISEAQQRRLYAIASRSGRFDQDVKSWLKNVWRVDSSKEIRRCDYDAICTAIESNQDLPTTREPGEEG